MRSANSGCDGSRSAFARRPRSPPTARRSRSATFRCSTRRRRRRESTRSMTVRGSSSSAAAARRSTATARAFPSVFLAGGKNPAKLFVNTSKRGGPLKFEEKPLDIGADPKLLENVIGAYPIDIDGDGHVDLFVLRVGENLLLKGGPDCTFTLANKEWNFDGDAGWTTSFSAEWEKGQKFPTLAIGHYVDRNAPGSPWGTCEDNSLYRPQPGDKPDYSARTPLAPGFCALSMLFTDWNRSGTPSLSVSNDRQYYRGGEEQMWRIEPGKPPKLYSPRRRLAACVDLRHGHRRGRHRRLGLSAICADLDGRHQAAEARPRRRRARRISGLSRHRRRESARPRISLIPAATSGPRPAGTPNSPISTTTASSTSSSPRAISRRCPTSPPTIRATCSSASGTASSPRPATSPGSPATAQGRGALIADFNLDGMLDILQIDRGSECRAVPQPRRQHRGGGRCRWATGPRSSSSSRTPTATPSALTSPSRPARARRCAPSRSAAATPRATSAGSMSASARPSAPRSACNGRTANGAIPTACSPTSSSSRPHEAAGGILVSGAVARLGEGEPRSLRVRTGSGPVELAMKIPLVRTRVRLDGPKRTRATAAVIGAWRLGMAVARD